MDRVDSSDQRYGLASLNLTKVTEKDRGWYNCKVLFLDRGPDAAVVSISSLSLEESFNWYTNYNSIVRNVKILSFFPLEWYMVSSWRTCKTTFCPKTWRYRIRRHKGSSHSHLPGKIIILILKINLNSSINRNYTKLDFCNHLL